MKNEDLVFDFDELHRDETEVLLLDALQSLNTKQLHDYTLSQIPTPSAKSPRRR